jgi:hypothetical protein
MYPECVQIYSQCSYSLDTQCSKEELKMVKNLTGNFLVIKGSSGNKTEAEILTDESQGIRFFLPTTDLAPSGQTMPFTMTIRWSVNKDKYSEALKFIIPQWTFSHSFFRDAIRLKMLRCMFLIKFRLNL